MNILFLTEKYLPHIGGVERHISHLSGELIKDSNKVTVFTFSDSSESIAADQGEAKIIRYKKGNGLYLKLFINIKFFLQFLFFGKYDIIHFHDFSAAYYLLPALFIPLKLYKRKFYITYHGWEGDFPPEQHCIRKRKLFERLTNGNICIGDYITKWYGTNADTVTYGAVTKTDSFIDENNTMVFIGRLEKDTGIDKFISAFKKIHFIHQKFKMIVCGEGSLKSILDAKDGIEFKGNVQDVNEYLKPAKIVFVPGYLSMLEAFSNKKSVVAYYDNELKKDYFTMIPHSDEMLFLASTTEEIIKAVELALNDKTRKEAAYKFSLEHSWSRMKENYYKLWKKKNEHI
jgi:glycosyltransferase involved in cell wall biosynthesis